MSLILTIYTRDGIVLASDSRTTINQTRQFTPGQSIKIPSGQYFDTTEKTFLINERCGVSTCGDGSIGNSTVSTHIKQFRKKIIGAMDSIKDIAEKLLNYSKNLNSNANIIYHVFGYDIDTENDNKIAKGYKVNTNGSGSVLDIIQSATSTGATWDGETDVLIRIIKQLYFVGKYDPIPNGSLITRPDGIQINVKESFLIEKNNITTYKERDVPWHLMTIQDAVDFANFAIKTTIDTMKFTVAHKTVGGPIDILAITPLHSKWV